MIEEKSITLPGITSAYQAEMQTFLEAFKFILNSGLDLEGKNEILVRIDCQSVISAVGSLAKNDYYTSDFWNLLAQFEEDGLEVRISNVKAHNGEIWNERVDELAKRGASVAPQGPMCPVSLGAAKKRLKRVIQARNTGQDCSDHYKSTKDPNAKNNSLVSSFPEGLHRREGKIINQLRGGKCNITKDRTFDLGLSTNDICPGCQDSPDSISHLLVGCPAYAIKRERYLGHNIKLDILTRDPPKLIKYLKEINRTYMDLKNDEKTERYLQGGYYGRKKNARGKNAHRAFY